MGRARGVGRWAVAVPAGLAVNLLLIGLLSLVERSVPPASPPTLLVEIDRPEPAPRRPTPQRAAVKSSTAGSAPSPKAAGPDGATETRGDGGEALAGGPSGQASPEVDPAWRVDPQAVERWRITEGNPAFGWGRYHRACKGLSSEHLTDEEKERCWGGFAARVPKPADPDAPRLKPVFKPRGLPPPPPSWAKDAARQARCAAYREGRAEQPRLRDGRC